MRIAYPSKDGIHIWGHPGRAEYIVIVTVEGDKIVQKEVLPNTVKHHEQGERKVPKDITQERNKPEIITIGKEPVQKEKGERRRKENLWAILKGVDLFVTRSCGEGFKRNLQSIGVKLVLTKEKDIEKFLKDYLLEVRK